MSSLAEEKPEEMRIVFKKTPDKRTVIEVEGRWTIDFPESAEDVRKVGGKLKELGEKIEGKASE